MKKQLRTGFSLSAIALALSVLVGCANYKLGTTLSEDLRAVYVPTVRNQTHQPGIEREVTRALLNEIQREGTMRLASKDEASTRLDVVVTSFDQNSIRYNQENNNMSEEYRMTLRASVIFTNLNAEDATKATLVQNVVLGEETFLRGADSITAQQRAIPKAAKDLAERIVDECVSAW